MRILLWLLLLTFLSCGDTSDPESIAPTVAQEIQRDISFTVRRYYNPSTWLNYTEEVVKTTEARMPIEIEVTEGNSGKGWLSIVTPERKFCYQGNATNIRTANGTRYILIKEKSVLSEDCELTVNDQLFDREITLVQGEQIHVTIHGGGCSQTPNTCLTTTARGNIEITQ